MFFFGGFWGINSDKADGNFGPIAGNFDGVTICDSDYLELTGKANGRYYENKDYQACENPMLFFSTSHQLHLPSSPIANISYRSQDLIQI